MLTEFNEESALASNYLEKLSQALII